jgi:hypothetical protein
MSYQPYPTSGAEPPAAGPPAPGRSQPPAPVRYAVMLMYAGAAFSLAGLIVTLVTASSYRTAIHKAFPHYTTTQVHQLASALVTLNMVFAVIEIFLWLLVAWACRGGHNWGRIAGSVLFVLNTALLLFALTRTSATFGFLLSGLIWLAGLGAVVMLWRKESTAYFTPGR